MNLYLIILLLVSSLISQPGMGNVKTYIRGEIVDSFTDEAVENIYVTILKEGNEIEGMFTDEDGFFKTKSLPFGRYTVKIEPLGYKPPDVVDVAIYPTNEQVDIGKVSIERLMIEMEETTIKEDKPIVEFKIDKRVVNVDQLNVTGNAVDILEETPGLTVDIDGNVELRGNANITILVDGRKSDKDAINFYDASMIEKIEIITIPSAKFDVEGTAGIVNLITNKNDYVGKTGKLSIGGGSWGKKNLTGKVNYATDLMNLSASLSFKNRIMKGYSNNTNYWIEAGQASETFNRIDSNTKDKDNNKLKLSGDFYLNEFNTVVFDMMFSAYRGTNEINSFYRYLGVEDNDMIMEEESGNDAKYMVGFYKEFNNPGQKLNMELDKNTSSSIESINYSGVFSLEDFNNNKRNFKLDYTHPRSAKYQDTDPIIEIGFKDELNRFSSLFEYNNNIYDFNYYKSVLSIYFNVSHYFNPSLGFMFGTRFETVSRNTLTSQIQSGGVQDIFTYLLNENLNQTVEEQYNKAYPFFTLLYSMGDKGDLQFGFGKRVDRPWRSNLNPYPNVSNAQMIRLGNPYLKPSDTFKYELNYSFGGFLGTTLFISKSTNSMDFWDEDDVYGIDTDVNGDGSIEGDEIGINIDINGDGLIDEHDVAHTMSPDNKGKSEEFGFDLWMMAPISKKYTVMFWGMFVSSRTIESDEDDHLGDAQFYHCSIRNTLKFGKDKSIKLQINPGFWAAKKSTRNIPNRTWTDVSLQKEFSDKFSMTFKIKDLFETGGIEYTETEALSPSVTEFKVYEGRWNTRHFNLSFDVKFGEFKEKRQSSHYDSEDGNMMGF